MTNAPLTVSTGCWFAISSILGATVLIVGLAPPPLVLFLGVPLASGFLAVGAIWGKRDAILSDAQASQVPVFIGMAAFSVALLLRGSDVSWFLVPLLALALFAGCFVWARKRSSALQPET